MLDEYRTIEIIMERPTDRPGWRWCICVPESHWVEIDSGYGIDQEDAWQKAVRAKNYIQKYGLASDRK